MQVALVCCKSGMGTSMLLKTKTDQVIKEYHLPITTMPGTLDSLLTFDGDLVITMNDIADEIRGKVPYVVGIDSVINKEEIHQKLSDYLSWKESR